MLSRKSARACRLGQDHEGLGLSGAQILGGRVCLEARRLLRVEGSDEPNND